MLEARDQPEMSQETWLCIEIGSSKRPPFLYNSIFFSLTMLGLFVFCVCVNLQIKKKQSSI